MDPQWSVFFSAECAVAAHSRLTLKRMTGTRTALVDSQLWKLRVAFAVVLVAGVLMWFDPQVSVLTGVPQYLPTLVGMLLAFMTLAISVIAVRCPSCGASLLWFAISQKTANGWLAWLLHESTCPKCSFSVGNNEAGKNAL